MQAYHMGTLGNAVCPEVYKIEDRGYTMEWVEQRPIAPTDPTTIYSTLSEEVWCRPNPHPNSHWESQMRDWLELGGYAPKIPNSVRLERQCLVHGDPTVSNLMWRDEWSPVLIDAIRPIGKIAPTRTSDVACILQSLCGWEVMTCGPHPAYKWPKAIDDDQQGSVLWWLWVKAERIKPYAQDDRIREWCDNVQIHIEDYSRRWGLGIL